jgi:hypothetical protein
VEVDYWSSTTNPRCNLSLYNASLILFAGDPQFPPRVDVPEAITHYGIDTHWIAHSCTPAQYWFNVCIKYFSFYFTFVNALPLPWTFSIFFNAYSPRSLARGKLGVDFYGRRTESLWFHLPIKARTTVANLTLFALIVQIPDCICHLIYASYVATQVWPGGLLTNIWLGLQLSCQLAASVIQGRAEDRVRRAQPGRFPPTIGQYLKDAYRRWKAAHDGEAVGCGKGLCLSMCCGQASFVTFVLDEVRKFTEEKSRFGHICVLSGVAKGEIGMKEKALARTGGSRAFDGEAMALAQSLQGRRPGSTCARVQPSISVPVEIRK